MDVPTFLDFEASSLSQDSYPIEVAWNLEDGSIEGHLICPEGIPAWSGWDPAAQRVHGIPREELLARGKSPMWVCSRMNQQLANRIVYSDAPLFDGMWLAKLFAVTNNLSPVFQLRHIDELLVKMICPEIAGRSYGLIRIGALKEEARKHRPKEHRAAWDVEYLVQVWELAAYEAKSRGSK